jgi:ubiquinone/menaquinone biosynthesis C-methylase UbiE
MERATKDLFARTSLRHEHTHRYELASILARGIVVDCACGIGYGSEILFRQGMVKSYLGIDPSADTIQYAKDNFGGEGVYFELGSLESNSCADFSVDRFLMFETLEHTENPHVALENVRRCLKQDGLLIGSVPSAEYEALCGSIYGPNPFHLQRFSKEQIVSLLGEYFESVQIFSMEFVLGSLVRSADNRMDSGAEILASPSGDNNDTFGSIIFLAGTEEVVSEAMKEFGAPNKFFPSTCKAILDREEIEPIRLAVQSMDTMVRDRDETIASQASVVEKRWDIIQLMDARINELQQLIHKQSTALGALVILFSAIKTSLIDRFVRTKEKNE